MFSSGLIDLAIKNNTLIGGDDFKSGQTKMKSVLVDFLVGAGIKVRYIILYMIAIYHVFISFYADLTMATWKQILSFLLIIAANVDSELQSSWKQ